MNRLPFHLLGMMMIPCAPLMVKVSTVFHCAAAGTVETRHRIRAASNRLFMRAISSRFATWPHGAALYRRAGDDQATRTAITIDRPPPHAYRARMRTLALFLSLGCATIAA